MTMPHDEVLRKRRRLMAIDPKCHWCHRKLKLYPGFKQSKDNPLPDDFPTLDHIYSKWIAPTGMKRNKYIVLACKKCNEDRALAEQRHSDFRRYWKSGSFPPPYRFLGHVLQAVRAYKASVNRARNYDKQMREKR